MADRATFVKTLPPCDICAMFGEEKPLPAFADARLAKGSRRGSWAYVCRQHFDSHDCELGLGRGQKLLVRS